MGGLVSVERWACSKSVLLRWYARELKDWTSGLHREVASGFYTTQDTSVDIVQVRGKCVSSDHELSLEGQIKPEVLLCLCEAMTLAWLIVMHPIPQAAPNACV